MVEDISGYYTFRGFQAQKNAAATAAMEDYLEMIYRIAAEGNDGVRVKELAQLLHVQPSSVSRMMHNLREAGWVTEARYGRIYLTCRGEELGKYLLYRHDVIYDFLCMLNGNDRQLPQTERIEHFLDRDTVENLRQLTEKIFFYREKER